MKKILSFLLIACMLFSFSACTSEPNTVPDPPQPMTQADLATIMAFSTLMDEFSETPNANLPYESAVLHMTLYSAEASFEASSPTNVVSTMNASFSTFDNKKHSLTQSNTMTIDDPKDPTITGISCTLDGKNIDMSEFFILLKTQMCIDSYNADSTNTLPFTYKDTRLENYEKGNNINTFDKATILINGSTYEVVLGNSPSNTFINGNLLFK